MPATRKVGYVAARFARVAVPLVMLAASTLTLATGPGPAPASEAASHREAPLIAMDPEADITDFFMFRSYETGKDDKILLIMNVIPGQEPSSGPNYWNFDPTVLYSFEVDNDLDGKADDVQVDVQFTTEPIRGTCNQFDLFLSYVALPPITKLDGDNGSEGLCLRQHYSVTMSHKGHHDTFSSDKDGKTLFAVPSNVGPRTMPSYDSLASQGIYELSNGIRVF